MEIKASCRYDLSSVKAFTRLSMFKKAKPEKRFILETVFFAVLEVLLLMEMIVFGLDSELLTLAVVLGVWYLLFIYLYFLVPKIRYNAMAKLKDVENLYVFGENAVQVTTGGADMNGKSTIDYTVFVKAYETSRYLYLFQTKNQAYIVDKSTITGGTVEELREKLTLYLKKKYIRCRY